MRCTIECLGYVCVEDVVASEPFPPFRASIKDGYAVRLYFDRTREQLYEVVGRSDAGGDDVTIMKSAFEAVVHITPTF